MKNEPKKFTRVISVRWLLFTYLKLWRVILLAILIGGLLMGGYKAVSAASAVEDAALVAENEEQISANNGRIEECTEKIAKNMEDIQTGRDEINYLQDEVGLQTQRLATLEAYLATCEEALAKAQSLAASAGEDSAVILSQLAECSQRVQDTNDQIYELKTSLTTNQRNLKRCKEVVEEELPLENQALQTELLTLQMKNATLQAEMEPKPADKSLKSIVKFALVGGFMGAALVGCWLICKLRVQNRLYSEEELKDCFGFYELGSLAVAHGKHATKLDLLLEQWNGESRQIDEEAAYRLMAARLQAVSNEGDSFVLSGTVEEAALERVCHGLTQYLPAGNRVDMVAAPLNSPEAIVSLKNARVILVEAKDVSSMREIGRLAEQLWVGNAQIAGYVVI